jgi:hypothetical protein
MNARGKNDANEYTSIDCVSIETGIKRENIICDYKIFSLEEKNRTIDIVR